MKASDVRVEDFPSGTLRITVPDDSTDSLAIIELRGRFGNLSATVRLRGNWSGSTRYGARGEQVRPCVTAVTSIPAPPVTPPELDRRRATLGLPPKRDPRLDIVAKELDKAILSPYPSLDQTSAAILAALDGEESQ